MTNTPLYYPVEEGSPAYEVELFDQVELTVRGMYTIPFDVEGTVTKIFPKLKMVRVRFEDYNQINSMGHGYMRSVRVPVEECALVRRDG